MDDRVFDGLTKSLVGPGGRRAFLRRLTGAALFAGLGGGALVDTAGAARCREGGRTCRENANCCGGLCLGPDDTGRRRCACENGQPICGITCCAVDESCIDGACVPACVPEGGDCDPELSLCCDDLTCLFTETGSTGFQCGVFIP